MRALANQRRPGERAPHQTWPFEKATPRANAASDRLAVAVPLFPSLSLFLVRFADPLRSCTAVANGHFADSSNR